MNIREIFDDSYQQCGLGRMTTGDQARTAMTALKLLLRDWDNRQLNFFQVQALTVNLSAGVASYNQAATTIDILSLSRRDSSGTEIELEPISLGTYQALTDKDQSGPPLQYMVLRQAAYPVLYIWPVPADTSYTLTGWRLVSTVGTTYTIDESLDVPPAMVAALSSGLAYFLAKRNLDKIPESRLMILKGDYDEAWARAKAADTQKTDMVYARAV